MNGDTQEWLKGFFGPGNGWSLEKISAATYPGPLQARLDSMLRPCFLGQPPFLLPRVDDNRRLSFYVVAETRRQLMEINRVLRAFLGNVNTYLDPRVFVQAEDDVEESLLAHCTQGFSKVLVPPQVSQDKPQSYAIFDTLNRAIELYGNRPANLAILPRNTGRILRDFFTACARQDGQAATQYLDEVKLTGQLSGRNLISLEIQALAADSRWSTLLEHPRLADLLSGRAPRRVVQITLRAIDHAVINAEAYSEHDAQEVRSSLERVDSIFLRQPDLDQSDPDRLWKTWCIGAASYGNTCFLDNRISQRVGEDWVAALAAWAGLEKPEIVRREHPLESDLTAPPSFDAAVSLLQRSLSLNPNEGIRIYTRLAEYPGEIIRRLEAHATLRGVLESLASEYSNPVDVGDWSGWLDSLIQSPQEARSIQDISESCVYWDIDGWQEADVIQKLYLLADSDRVSEIRNALPVLLGWLRDKEIDVSASFISAVALILSADEAFSVQDLALFSSFIEALTQVSHTRDQYHDIVGAARECWKRVQSVRALEPALEVMDLLLDSVCADEQSRLQYWNSLQEFCIGSWKRLTVDQKLIVLSCSEGTTGETSQFPSLERTDQEKIDLQRDFSGRRLAIYTLTEGAGRRASEVLQKMFPSLEIKLNHDKTATPALVNLAKTADYFVFSSRSAAHQAFYPVTKEREEILYPAGKGSSSIVRCCLDALTGH